MDLAKHTNDLMQRNQYHKMAWMRAEERIANMENMLDSAMNAVEHACLKLKEQGEARRADERQLAELCAERNDLAAHIEEVRKENARLARLELNGAFDAPKERERAESAEARIKALEEDNARLLAVAQKEPHTAYLESVQRACDERMVALKHAEREATVRAEEAERQLAEALRIQGQECERADKFEDEVNTVREQLSAAWRRAEAAERQLAEVNEKVGALIEDKAVLTECNEAAERQLTEARAAIAGALNELDEAPTGPNDPFIVAAQERLRAAIQDRAPVKGKPCPNCRGTGECDFGSEFASSVCPSCAGSGVRPC